MCVGVCCTPTCYSDCGVSAICSLLMFVSDGSGGHMVETYLSMGLVMALYVVSIVSFYFIHAVEVSSLSICIVLHAFVVRFLCFVACEFEVESQS